MSAKDSARLVAAAVSAVSREYDAVVTERVKLWLRRRKAVHGFTTDQGELVDAFLLEVFGEESL